MTEWFLQWAGPRNNSARRLCLRRKGGNVPFILGEKGISIQLVEEAYIHGIMKGEAFDEGESEDIEVVQMVPEVLLEVAPSRRVYATLSPISENP